ncbi:hypothetical protein KAR91_01690 [Candidatus Pacearchaeota archaeon]|nr:hypothetical protein [Candidatus Pacearchaeota archaeon]
MNITIAIIFVKGTATTRIESECLVECTVEGQSGGAMIDRHRQLLEQTFGEIHNTSDIEVLFPELGECVE